MGVLSEADHGANLLDKFRSPECKKRRQLAIINFIYHRESIIVAFTVILYYFIFFIILIRHSSLAVTFIASPITFFTANLILCVLIFYYGLPTKLISPGYLSTFSDKYLKDLFHVPNREAFNTLRDRALINIKFFEKYWRATALIWILYYAYELVIFFITSNSIVAHSDNMPIRMDVFIFDLIGSVKTQEFITNALNMASTFTLFCCFIIIAKRTFKTDDEKKFYLPHKITSLLVLASLLMFEIIYKLSTIDTYISNIGIALALIYGLISATVFVLLTGRLDSKYLRVPGILIAILYCYAFLQLIFPIISLHGSAQIDGVNKNPFFKTFIIVAYHLGLIFKTFLMLLFTWLFKSGKIFFYLLRVRIYTEIFESQDKEIIKHLKMEHQKSIKLKMNMNDD